MAALPGGLYTYPLPLKAETITGRELGVVLVTSNVPSHQGTISNCAIIEWLEWSRRWQWNTYLPVYSVNLAAMRTVWPARTTTVSFQPASPGPGGSPSRSSTRNCTRCRCRLCGMPNGSLLVIRQTSG